MRFNNNQIIAVQHEMEIQFFLPLKSNYGGGCPRSPMKLAPMPRPSSGRP